MEPLRFLVFRIACCFLIVDFRTLLRFFSLFIFAFFSLLLLVAFFVDYISLPALELAALEYDHAVRVRLVVLVLVHIENCQNLQQNARHSGKEHERDFPVHPLEGLVQALILRAEVGG